MLLPLEAAHLAMRAMEIVAFRAKRRSLAEWDESQHPRDEAGKFTDSGSSSKEKVLSSGKITSSSQVGGSVNAIFRVTMTDGQGHTVDAILKPTAGESWTNGEMGRKQFFETYKVDPESELGQQIIAGDFDNPAIRDLPAFDPDDYADFEDDSPVRDTITNKDFSFAEREVAAYEVDQALGLGVVPPTSMRKDGMVQEFVTQDDDSITDPDSVYGAAILDIMIGNTDRHSGNYLVRNGKFVAIDHGLSFPDSGMEFRPDATVSEIFNLAASARMSKAFEAKVREKLEDTDWKKLAGRWKLSSGEKKAFFDRIRILRTAFEDYEDSTHAVKDAMRQLVKQSTISQYAVDNPEALQF